MRELGIIFHAVKDPHQCRLSGAVFAKDRVDFAGADIHADPHVGANRPVGFVDGDCAQNGVIEVAPTGRLVGDYFFRVDRSNLSASPGFVSSGTFIRRDLMSARTVSNLACASAGMTVFMAGFGAHPPKPSAIPM